MKNHFFLFKQYLNYILRSHTSQKKTGTILIKFVHGSVGRAWNENVSGAGSAFCLECINYAVLGERWWYFRFSQCSCESLVNWKLISKFIFGQSLVNHWHATALNSLWHWRRNKNQWKFFSSSFSFSRNAKQSLRRNNVSLPLRSREWDFLLQEIWWNSGFMDVSTKAR